MSKQAFKRLRRYLKMEVNRKPLDSWAWPGGYPLYYICEDNGIFCSECINKEIDLIDEARRHKGHPSWIVVGVDVNYEDTSLFCSFCDKRIDPAYGEEGNGN